MRAKEAARKYANRAAGRTVERPCDVQEILAAQCRGLEQECFWVLAVNSRNQLIGFEMIAKGTAASVEVHPRDVFRYAIRINAVGIIVAHNHPSGDPTPSPEDILLTRRLMDVGKIVGVPVVDHVVICSSGSHRSIIECVGDFLP